MQTASLTSSDITTLSLRQDIGHAIRAGRLVEAEAKLQVLAELEPDSRALLVLQSMLGIRLGQVLDVVRRLNQLPDDAVPEMKALCLKLIGDPTWYGYATALEDSPDPSIRKAMRGLLGRPEEVVGQ